jgi:hypothetical protein
MKTNGINSCLIASLAAICLLNLTAASGGGLPEPGLVMYGAVRNAANANARLTAGTLTWTISPPSGSPVTVSTALTDISGQYSYVLRVPFETVVGSSTLSPNALALNSATTSYVRTNVFLTVNGTNYPATISAPALGTFSFGSADRGRLEEVDLTVTAPGVGGSTGGSPSFASPPHFVNGQFQMTVSGTIGQSYTLLTSTDLVAWVPEFAFICTNSTMTISDLMATNFARRFYRLDSQ